MLKVSTPVINVLWKRTFERCHRSKDKFICIHKGGSFSLVVVLAPYKGSKLVISKKPCILIKIGKEFNWCGQSWNWLRFKYSGLSVALFVPFLFVISILFVFISFCAEELKNHLLCYKWLRLERRKIPLYILHDDWPCSGHIATSMFNLPSLTFNTEFRVVKILGKLPQYLGVMQEH